MVIHHVDAPSSPSHARIERPPARDFAQELIEGDKRMSGVLHPRASSPEKATSFPAARHPLAPVQSVGSTTTSIGPAASGSASSTDGESLLGAELVSVLVQPAGVTETLLAARVYGVHLMASPYLSELVEQEIDKPVQPSISVGAVEPSDGSTENQAVPSIALADLSARMPAGASRQQVSVVADLPVEIGPKSPATVSRSAGVTVSASAAAVAEFWPEASMRFTRRADGGTVLWLRDYRISDEGGAQLVAIMIKEAMAQGTPLSRVVLNGREAWTRGTTD